YTELFDVVDSRHRIFSYRQALAPVPIDFKAPFSTRSPARPSDTGEMSPLWNALDVQREADRGLLSRYAPVGVVVDEAMTVLQFRGRTAPYLEPAPGLASLDLFRMLRDGLLAEVRAATAQAKAENTIVTRDGLQVMDGDTIRSIGVEVIP